MQRAEANKPVKCWTLESPKTSYNALLFRIKDNFGESEMENFKFAFRSDLPKNVLEARNPLKWFNELENRCLLSPDDLGCLINFLQLVSLKSLLEDVHCFQAKRRIVVFFQKSVEEKILGLCLDEKFNQSWTSKEPLPRNFVRKCQELFREIDSETYTVQDLFNLLSRGAEFLVNSCLPCSHNLDLVAMKILYLSNIFFQRFERMIVEQMDVLKALLSRSRRPSLRIHRRPEPVPVVQPYEMERPLFNIKHLFLVNIFFLATLTCSCLLYVNTASKYQ